MKDIIKDLQFMRDCMEEDGHSGNACFLQKVIDTMQELQEQIPKWHMVADGDLPRCEEKVLILAERKYRDGATRKIYTTAMYEDGTIRENDSSWYWEDIDGEYDEEEDCFIIPRGWYEDKSYTPDGQLNYEIDDKVIAWMELPKFSEVE